MVGNYYWTASPDTGLAGVSHYWSVSFYNGIVSSDAAELEHYTRCVRSPTPVATGAPRTRLTIDEAADLITDTRTGLVWQRTPSANAVPRPEAFATCAALGAGLRLPTAKELLTLVDPMRSNPSLLEGFPDPPSKGFWSASLNGSRPDTYVGVYFSDGHTSWASPEVLYYVRCVR